MIDKDFRSSPVTLDQLHVLDVLERAGSVAQAALILRRAHSALLYSVRNLESHLNVQLVDRSGYRLSLTPVGMRILEKARAVLQAEEDLRALASMHDAGWETELKLVYDGLIDPSPLLSAAMKVREKSPATQLSLYSEFLGGVELAFERHDAAAMITLFHDAVAYPRFQTLKPVRSLLVAHRDHALTHGKQRVKDLQQHPFLMVRGTDGRLEMSTKGIAPSSTFHVADFVTKKLPLLKKYGYGWMPEYLIAGELKRKTLRIIQWEGSSEHVFRPVLCFRSRLAEGPALRLFSSALEDDF